MADTSPIHPRWLSSKVAAAYLCLSQDSFQRKVKAGRLPGPSRHLGPKIARWDREALDAAMLGTPRPERTAASIIDERIAQLRIGLEEEGRQKREQRARREAERAEQEARRAARLSAKGRAS